MKDFFRTRQPHQGLTYVRYLEAWAEALQEDTAGLAKEARKMHHYRTYNHERSQRVHAAYAPSEALREAMASIRGPQLWMVLTETWCGDSAFCLPVLAEAAALADAVTLRVLPRDENLDIMDQYLTGGTSRSIPKLVGFEAETGEELFEWGPRPEAAQALFDREQAAGKDKQEAVQALIAWYEDGGWSAVDTELAAAVGQARRRA